MANLWDEDIDNTLDGIEAWTQLHLLAAAEHYGPDSVGGSIHVA